MVNVLDFTHIINEQAVFPGDDPPEFFSHCTLEKDGFLETRLNISSHTGTHMDAPAHMIKGGAFLNQFSLEKYMGTGIVVHVPNNYPGQPIGTENLSFLESYRGKIDFVLLYTGWSRFWGQKRYLRDFPVLTAAAALQLSTFNLKGIGTDTISIDPMTSEDFENHRIFMTRNIVIIENLANLSAAPRGTFPFFCIPLFFEKADGSPVRAFTYLPASGSLESI